MENLYTAEIDPYLDKDLAEEPECRWIFIFHYFLDFCVKQERFFSKSECIPQGWRCDGIIDCDDARKPFYADYK